ncbi:MAG: hypothetical protein V3S64_10380, partial [bacterium]
PAVGPAAGNFELPNDGKLRVYLGWVHHNAHPFWLERSERIHPSYVMEKLGLNNAHSANLIADFISCLSEMLGGGD